MAVHAFFMFPETAGKTLEDVELMFTAKVPAWKTRVEYRKILAVEHGEVNPDKMKHFAESDVVEEKDVAREV